MRDVLETCSTASAPFYVARWTLRRGHTSLIAAFAPASRVLSLVLAWMPHGYVLLPELLLRGVARMCMRHVRVEEIADGNVNFSFAVRGRFGRALFVKQARGFLKWQPQMALERERMAREVQYFKDAAAALEMAVARKDEGNEAFRRSRLGAAEAKYGCALDELHIVTASTALQVAVAGEQRRVYVPHWPPWM